MTLFADLNTDGLQDIVFSEAGGDPFGAGAHGLTRFDRAPPDPVVVAALLAGYLEAAAAHHRGEVFRPLTDVNPEHPVFGEFHTI